MQRTQTTLNTHDGLLGGGGAEPATRRVSNLETAAATAERERAGLTTRLEALEKVAQSETPRIGFLRYNAFDDVGSDQSYALALLTRDGDGVVLSSIYSREETRTYGKAVTEVPNAARSLGEEREGDRPGQGGRDRDEQRLPDQDHSAGRLQRLPAALQPHAWPSRSPSDSSR